MWSATVINSQGNEVTVNTQFSQRRIAFITHLILWRKQVSSERLSRQGGMTTYSAKISILLWVKRKKQQTVNRKETKKNTENINKKKKEKLNSA